MRILVTVSLVLFLTSGQGLAKVSVSPVIIEATNVKKGDTFQVWCEQDGTTPLDIHLSLALFDQNEDGSVYFLEDPHSIQRAGKVLSLGQEQLSLAPQGKSVLEIEVLQDDFTSFYAVLFVKPEQSALHTRFAVLLLLSTEGLEDEMRVSAWEHREQNLELTIVNDGSRHGLWQGELLLYDNQGNLGEKRSVQSGVVLAGRSREWEISLPAWVVKVELTTSVQGVER